MTEDQLEKSARALCKIRGLDADQKVTYTDITSGRPLRAPRWFALKNEVTAFAQLTEAIKAGKAKKKG